MIQKIILLIFPGFVFLQTFAQMKTETKYLRQKNYIRSFEIYVPDNFSPEHRYPVLLVLHGGGGTAKGLVRHTRGQFNRLARQNNFVVVYPQGLKKGWNDGRHDTINFAAEMNIDDVGFIEKILEDLDSKIQMDKTKVFTCGISNGGFMVQRLAYEIPEKIKGIAVIAANLSEVQAAKDFPEKAVPVLFINGTEDPLVPYNGGHVTVFREKRGKVLSMAKTIETWKEINGCEKLAESKAIPDRNKSDGCRAFKTTWENPKNEFTRVVAIKIEGGGHTWPGATRNLPRRLVGNSCRDFNACDEVWNFFNSIRKN